MYRGRMARGKRARRPSRAETRERLLAASEQVFVRRGLQAASIEEIAEEAGLSRGAFYSNFDKKEDLFVELLHRRVYDRYREILERSPSEGDPLERLRAGVRELMKQYERPDGQWLFALWLELLAHVARHPEFRELAATFWKGNRAVLAEIIEEVYREHGESPPIPPKDLATAQIALDIGLAVQNFVDEAEVPLELYPVVFDTLFAPLLPAE
jgi:AcrR family transcriptional regulator